MIIVLYRYILSAISNEKMDVTVIVLVVNFLGIFIPGVNC